MIALLICQLIGHDWGCFGTYNIGSQIDTENSERVVPDISKTAWVCHRCYGYKTEEFNWRIP